MIKGYKCFNKDMTNRYGIKFEVGKTYTTFGNIKFGLNGNGYHMCKNMEDTLRYYDAIGDDVIICEVTGYGKYVLDEDDYYGYYDMYSVEIIKIERMISRDEIIEIALNLNEIQVLHFIKTFKLNTEEINLFKNKFKNFPLVIQSIEYYQENNLEVFSLIRKR